MASKCQNCGRDADGMPPCDHFVGHQRPDGWYCDCGHEAKCHKAKESK
jgi:hypothetical protein